ncbi:zinc-dependent dehydrogenase [Desulfatibacillum aliphaticivorans]|uniref:zinc-dependent dehydrogenase n=1 Tax=Desulfatibacillum aliphaticivorans TaxID=218208 RepID=UPI00041CEFD1|nr:zinc-dependent dehydrogenase [Desulfatibacillum aliphaticivorans]
MKKMKAACLTKIPKEIEVREIPVPEIGENEFLVKMHACSLCYTDVKACVHGKHFYIELYGLPWTPGHEMAGEIAVVGDRVTGYSVGQRVAVAPFNPCLECPPCKLGAYRFCHKAPGSFVQPGGFAEYFKVPGEGAHLRTLVLPNAVSYEEAALVEPVASCLHAVRKAGVPQGSTAAVIGAGPMGLILMQLAKAEGAVKVFMVDVDDQRLEQALDFGADEVINSAKENANQAIRLKTGFMGADVVFEAVGSAQTYLLALEMARGGGAVSLFGGMPGGSTVEIPSDLLHYHELTITGTSSFSPDDYKNALELIEAGKIDVKRLISHRFDSLDGVLEAVNLSLDKQGLKKVVLL